VGAKPATFCYWLFDLLGALPGDELVDLFPGSGGVARAWHYYGEASRLAAARHDASAVTVATDDGCDIGAKGFSGNVTPEPLLEYSATDR
jgi:hypothetical protein